MTASEKRKAVVDKYAQLIGRNLYSQTLRDYCFKKYKDGNYYSDCSSSISYSYKETGQSFGILNTAGMYNSKKLTKVEVKIINGIPDEESLRVGDMLLFAGEDASRPLKIGHVEMYCGDGQLCGHGSGRPSYKSLKAYCQSRYNQTASGGWHKGLVCVKRYIQDDASTPEPPKKSGWYDEDGGRRFYLGNTGEPVRNSWYQGADGHWYWFDGAGIMAHDTWYQYNGSWYYLGPDGAMLTGQQTIDGKWYVLDSSGRMIIEPITLTPAEDGAMYWPGLAE